MCGIAGIISLDGRPADPGIVRKMINAEKHRGPDDEGFYSDSIVNLGHARLSIIDLSRNAGQPMFDKKKSKCIIYNGEIFNYKELRGELESLGHQFVTKSDTEVILHAYDQWQSDALMKFNGMWSFAIWDIAKKELFVSRDRFGVKPFYFYNDGKTFVFASEIKSILSSGIVARKPNYQAIYDYLASGYGYMDISDYTFFDKIYKLKPGHYLKVFQPDRKVECKKYWDIAGRVTRPSKNIDDAIYMFRSIFEDSVRLRLRSDVKVGVALSGGLDSSAVACVAARVNKGERLSSFSSHYDDVEANEKKYIDMVLAKTPLEASFISTEPKDVFHDMDGIIWHQEEPYSTLSILPQWYVMKAAHDNGVKVLLTGQGGDEVMGGYHKYYFYLFADLIRSLKLWKALEEIKAFKEIKGDISVSKEVQRILLSSMAPGFMKNMKAVSKYTLPAYISSGFAQQYKNTVFPEKKFTSILNNDLYNAFKISPLPSLLHIDDRASMAHSVETRSPFLDYRLVELMFSLPAEFKIHKGMTKYILRQAMRGIVPDGVLDRRDKMGFPTPLKSWLRAGLKDKVKDLFNSPEFKARPYIDAGAAMDIYEKFINNGQGDEYALWSLVNLELWQRKYIDSSW